MGEGELTRRSAIATGSVGGLWVVRELIGFFVAEREEARKQKEHERELERQAQEHDQQMEEKRQQTKLERTAYQQIIEACTEGRFQWGE